MICTEYAAELFIEYAFDVVPVKYNNINLNRMIFVFIYYSLTKLIERSFSYQQKNFIGIQGAKQI